MTNRQEVQIQTRGPDGGNPPPTRQGRGAMGKEWRRPVRARLVEVIGVRPYQVKTKRREALWRGKPAPSGKARSPSGLHECMGDEMVAKSVGLTRGGLSGSA